MNVQICYLQMHSLCSLQEGASEIPRGWSHEWLLYSQQENTYTLCSYGTFMKFYHIINKHLTAIPTKIATSKQITDDRVLNNLILKGFTVNAGTLPQRHHQKQFKPV